MTTLNSALLDDDSSGEEFVPQEEPEEKEEKVRSKKRKKEPEVELLQDTQLDDLWAEMNASAAPKKPAVAASASAPVKVAASSVSAAAPKKPAVDVSKLLAQLQEAEAPKVETETVRFAGQEVKVEVKAKNKGAKDNVMSLLDEIKGKPKKINTIEKSELDWEAHKQKDRTVKDELQQHMRGGTYLEKVSFLKRAELREYAIERDSKTTKK